MTGWTFCVMFSEMATMEHVSCRTATRLGPRQRVSPQSRQSPAPPTETRPAPPSLPPLGRASPRVRATAMATAAQDLTQARSGWAQTG